MIAKLGQFVSALIHDSLSKVDGGRQVHVDISTAEKWCKYYGVTVNEGVVILHKAVDDDYTSPRGMSYRPGTIPVAPDWDDGDRECGGGLHFSPTPAMARAFHYDAERFIACPVAIEDIAVHPKGLYPEKVKAKGCCAPVWEVNEDGERIA
ncbi:MAG: hypothetical protein MZW92_32020 [Comamonadaceae bacterium]|nr:hypothetical protein [Comamonadaceae bacterium]